MRCKRCGETKPQTDFCHGLNKSQHPLRSGSGSVPPAVCQRIGVRIQRSSLGSPAFFLKQALRSLSPSQHHFARKAALMDMEQSPPRICYSIVFVSICRFCCETCRDHKQCAVELCKAWCDPDAERSTARQNLLVRGTCNSSRGYTDTDSPCSYKSKPTAMPHI